MGLMERWPSAEDIGFPIQRSSVMLCYVEFIYRRYLQFCKDYTIASLEANQV